ncbi:SMODS domain-containing nucleotidyltransferase [Granulicella sibirica]|uniref:SMODS domain-containing nucleotidyltransferase n=1 Tax=Granulicella sibirica TaxID=2479048 RepID=UPI0010089D23|nr:nucleotidyltransferase [Granulicella sibirica]
MGVAETFQAFRDEYVIGKDQMDSISYRYKRITRQLNTDFWETQSDTAHSLYIGSYGRDTAAKGVSDVDIWFRLPGRLYQQFNNHQGNGQSALLQAVRASMQKTYGTTSLKADGQVVVVSFTDGITFEILPGFVNASDTVTFPDSNDGGTWKTCDPQSEMTAFATRNAQANHNLKAICRMARIWKGQHNIAISGMLIDTLAYQFIDSWGEKDKSYLYHDWLVRDFFLYLSKQDRTQEWWRAPGSGSWVHKTGAFVAKAETAYDNALEAIRQTTAGQPTSARLSWQLIFGTTFNG